MVRRIVSCGMILFCAVNFILPTPTSADVVYNPSLGKFVSVDTKVFDTPEGQMEYADKMFAEGELEKAEEAYDNLFRKFPNSPLAQDALIQCGVVQERLQKYMEAFKNYQKVIDLYPHTAKLDEVTERQFKIGTLFMTGTKARFLRIPMLPGMPRAIKIFETITKNAPFSEYGMKAQFNIAMCHKKKGALRDAIDHFKRFNEEYPASDLRPEASYQIVECLYRMALRRSNDERIMQEAREELSAFIRDYAHAATVQKVKDMLVSLDENDAKRMYDIARYYEGDTYLGSAITYYKDVVATYPDTFWAAQAKQRLSNFENPERFLVEGQKVLEEKLSLLSQQAALTDGEEEKEKREREIDMVKSDLKKLEKEKRQEIKVRWEDYYRKKRELAQRKKELKLKEKKLEKDPAEDFKEAIARWKESLTAEEYSLADEEKTLRALEHTLGVRRIGALLAGAVSSIDDVNRFKAKEIEKYESNLADIEKEKETLYAEWKEKETVVGKLRGEQQTLIDSELESKQKRAVEEEVYLREQKTLRALEKEYNDLKKSMKQGIVFPQFLDMHKKSWEALTKPLSLMTEKKTETNENAPERAREKMKHLYDQYVKLRNDKARYESIIAVSHGQNDEPAEGGAESAVIPDVSGTPGREDQERVSQREARSSIMTVQKQLRKEHERIRDAEEKKQELIHGLEKAIAEYQKQQPLYKRVSQTAVSPVAFLGKGAYAFFFGFKDENNEIQKEAKKIETQKPTADESEEVRTYRTLIAAEEMHIQEADREIVALELELENLIKRLQGTFAVQSKQNVTHHPKKIAQNIEHITKEMEHIKKQFDEVRATYRTAREQKVEQVITPSVPEETDSKGTHERIQQDMLQALEERIRAQEQIVEEKERMLKDHAREETKKFLKRLKASQEHIEDNMKDNIREQRGLGEDIIECIQEQKKIYAAYQEVLQEKKERIKKHIQRVEKFQTDELATLQQIQKTVFQSLDDSMSRVNHLDEERAQLETVLETLSS